MFVLISLVRIKTIETDLGSHADMKKVLMWCIIAVIQAAGMILRLFPFCAASIIYFAFAAIIDHMEKRRAKRRG